jgi:hypothetical protein
LGFQNNPLGGRAKQGMSFRFPTLTVTTKAKLSFCDIPENVIQLSASALRCRPNPHRLIQRLMRETHEIRERSDRDPALAAKRGIVPKTPKCSHDIGRR